MCFCLCVTKALEGVYVTKRISYIIHTFHFSLLLSLSFTTLDAQTDDILSSLSEDMAHFNKVATTTKQNEHYQPYIISVFQGKELEQLGVANLKQALELVPGIDIATDNFNNMRPIARGSNSLAYGQTKLFINEVPVSNVIFDSYNEYLLMPVEMIKRIEVVRGPGSKTNGVNAYAGSINVITYAEDFKGFESSDKLVFKYGSYDYRMGGFTKTFKTDDLKIFIDFYYQEDHKKLPAGPDGLATGSLSILPAFDNRALSQDGDAPLWIKDYSLSTNITYKDFYLKARALDHTQGSAYGINLALPQQSDRVKLPNYYLELGYNTNINDFALDIKAGVKYDAFDSHAKLTPNGLSYIDAIAYKYTGAIIPRTFTDGIYAEHYALQRTLYQSSYLKYNGIDKHTLTVGYRALKEETIDMKTKMSDWSSGSPTLVDYTKLRPFLDETAKRETYIFSFQDEFQYNYNLSFIYGFNYETTSYQDAGFEPRISMVYQLNSDDIFKAMYSRSHRNASWQEMFVQNNSVKIGNPNLRPEKVDAFEAAYIRKFSTDTYLQTNLFYLQNKDQIYNSTAVAQYKNAMNTNIYGLELEYKGHLTSADKLYLNYSYVTGNSKIKETGKSTPLTNVSHHLAKAYYIYNINDALSLSSVAKYVSSKDRVSGDTRDNLKAYSTLDATLSYKNVKYDYDVMFSVKNIFDADVRYASPKDSYTEDYRQERRNFMLTLKKEF